MNDKRYQFTEYAKENAKDLGGMLFKIESLRREPILSLIGEHWTVKAVRLLAFTDENDSLTEVLRKNLFRRNLAELRGELFFFKDEESGAEIFIASEAPDFVSTVLNIKNGLVTVDNAENRLVIGFPLGCTAESLSRTYYRGNLENRIPLAMSNTWGDCNGFSRVCRDFVLCEIESGAEIGIDIVQVDDGWQRGNTADKSLRDEKGRRFFHGDFWETFPERFPEGLSEISRAASDAGIKLGMWFAPDSHDDFALLERDISVLRRAYIEDGVRFFKLDMYWIDSNTRRDRFEKLLTEIRSFGDDVHVQLDVTRDLRVNYLFCNNFGVVFVENRYTKDRTYFPHRSLRNLWSLGHYLPTFRFQFEVVNPDLNTDSYSETDPFAPVNYSMDYIFATAMLSSPLFWMEMQFLSEKRRAELAPIMKVWRDIRCELSEGEIIPIGAIPDGRSHTGFFVKGKNSYMLVFREVNDKADFELDVPVSCGEAELIISNADASARIAGGRAYLALSAPRAYALFKIK